MSERSKPPFRADHVGSLLRTASLKEARKKRARGELAEDDFKVIEDREVEGVIKKQETVGLKSVTDGEYRRISWNIDFLERLDNVESYVGERKVKFSSSGPQPRQVLLRITGKLGGYRPHPMIEHFNFLKAHTKATPKMTIPSPSSLHFRYGRDAVPTSLYPDMNDFYRDLGESYRKAHTKATPKMTIPSPSSLHFRYGRDAVPTSLYPDMNDFYRDLGESYRKAVHAFADAGCRYLQLDEVNLTY